MENSFYSLPLVLLPFLHYIHFPIWWETTLEDAGCLQAELSPKVPQGSSASPTERTLDTGTGHSLPIVQAGERTAVVAHRPVSVVS